MLTKIDDDFYLVLEDIYYLHKQKDGTWYMCMKNRSTHFEISDEDAKKIKLIMNLIMNKDDIEIEIETKIGPQQDKCCVKDELDNPVILKLAAGSSTYIYNCSRQPLVNETIWGAKSYDNVDLERKIFAEAAAPFIELMKPAPSFWQCVKNMFKGKSEEANSKGRD